MNRMLACGSASAIHTGLNTINLIALVARGSKFDLYVNEQLFSSVIDNSYTQGQIGLVAKETTSPTEVMFTNARVWEL